MTTYLHQVIAAQRGAEDEARRDLATIQKILSAGGDQNPLTGLSRTHEPRTDADVRQPAQSRRVQMTTAELVARYAPSWARVTDTQLTRMTGNTQAKGTIELDGQVLLRDAPATFLLYLEEQLKALITGLVDRLQVLDPAEEWDDGAALGRGIRATEERETLSTAKRPEKQVLAEATKEHPAQVRWFDTDVVTGTWSLVKYSGQLPLEQVQEIRHRAGRLLAAVQAAREEANRLEVTQRKAAGDIFRYVFGDLAGSG